MADVTLEFIAERLERIQTEQAAMRADMVEMHTAVVNTQSDIMVLGQHMLRIERDIVQIKDILARLERRIGKVETA